MKNFNWMMMLVSAFALLMASCTPNEEDPVTPTPSDDDFKVEVTEVTTSSVAYTITPRDLEAEYLVVLYDVATADEFTRDEYLVSTLYQELETEASSMGKTFLEYMPEFVDKGVIEGTFDRLAPDSEYYIIVFGVDASKKYAATTTINKVKVKTLAVDLVDVTFDIETSVDGNTAEFVVTPSNEELIWYFYTLPEATHAAYTDPEGQYQMSETDFILYCLQMQIEQYRGAGYSDNQILNALFHKGALELEAKDLIANTKYINIIAAFDVTEKGEISIISDITTTTYTTGNVKKKNFTIDISVTDVEANRAAILITPSDTKESFCWLCAEWDGKQTAEEVMNSVVELYGGWMNNGVMLYYGVQDYTGGPKSQYKYKVAAADTDYYVIAFGYAGGITTEPVMKTFRTLPAPDPATTEFTMKASNASPYGFDLNITASHETTYYYVDICGTEEYNEEALIKEINDGFDAMLEQAREQDPNTTPSQLLSTFYYTGNISTTASGMMPETTVMGYIFALDSKTGHVVKAHTFNPLATTTKLGSVHPKVELVGYYSGDEENGSVFDQPDATKGKAITVVKYTEFDGARTLFTTIVVGDCSNSVGMTDSEVWAKCVGYWNTCKTSSPYSFYITEWMQEYTALTYATDSTGLPGEIGRVMTLATAQDKGKIEDLKTLVDELNAAEKSSVAMPKSLVVEETPAAAPAAKVVEQPVVKEIKSNNIELIDGEIMSLNYIRPFYIRK